VPMRGIRDGTSVGAWAAQGQALCASSNNDAAQQRSVETALRANDPLPGPDVFAAAEDMKGILAFPVEDRKPASDRI